MHHTHELLKILRSLMIQKNYNKKTIFCLPKNWIVMIKISSAWKEINVDYKI